MCGRFTSKITWSELVRLYRIHDKQPALNLRPRYNVAPSQDIPIVRLQYLPALPHASLSWLCGRLGPAERRALREIVQGADVIEVEGQRFLLAPISDEGLEALEVFEAEGEDLENDLCDEPVNEKVFGGLGA